MVINGVAYRIAGTHADAWPPQVSLGEVKGETGQGLGGAVVLLADVKGGVLHLGFGDGHIPTFIAGIIIEPADLPSVLHAWGPAQDVLGAHNAKSPERLNALTLIDNAIGQVLAGFATAAGPGATPNFTGFGLPDPTGLPTVVPSPS